MRSFFKVPISRKFFVLAILIRVLIMPFLYHPDIKTYNFQASFLSKGVVNIYNFLNENKKVLPLKEDFVYQPLAYLSLGGYQILMKPLLGQGFNTWLWDASQQSVETVGIFRYLFILKIPLLIFDILIAFLLTKFFRESKKKKQVFTLWLFNPFSLFIIYAYSGFDVVVVAMVLLSLLMVKENKLVFSAIILAIAALFKTYPLLFLPLLVFRAKSFKRALYILLAGVGTFVLLSLPFYSKAFIDSALVSGLTTRIFSPGIDLGFGIKIALPLFLLSIIYFLSIEKSRVLERYFFLVGLILISFIHFHIQWIIWVLPFLFISLVKQKDNRIFLIFWMIFIFVLPFFYNDKQMTVSLFSLFSYHFSLVPTPFFIIQKIYNPYNFQTILQTVVSALAILISWKSLVYKK